MPIGKLHSTKYVNISLNLTIYSIFKFTHISSSSSVEFGDYISIENTINSLSSIKIFPNERTTELDYRIAEMHKLHRGQLPEEAEINYLENARKLPLYGVFTFRTIVIYLYSLSIYTHQINFSI